MSLRSFTLNELLTAAPEKAAPIALLDTLKTLPGTSAAKPSPVGGAKPSSGGRATTPPMVTVSRPLHGLAKVEAAFAAELERKAAKSRKAAASP